MASSQRKKKKIQECSKNWKKEIQQRKEKKRKDERKDDLYLINTL